MLMQVYGKEKITSRSTSNFEIKQCFDMNQENVFFCYYGLV